jgi:4-carboxymuconolactone decarboxylase
MGDERDELFETGIAIREEMFGAEHGRKKVEAADDFNRPFEDLVTNYCFGATWSRPGLDRAQRSMVTLAMLIALGRPWEIRVHTQGAIANGVTKEQIREICMQAAIYAGVPAAGEGLRGATEVLDRLGIE